MKTGIDWHAFAGILGTSTAVVLQNFNAIAAGLAATATAIYMLLRVVREWRKMKRDAQSNSGPLCENFSTKKGKNP
jgi:Kef-type K+ transport system membrane component KefB